MLMSRIFVCIQQVSSLKWILNLYMYYDELNKTVSFQLGLLFDEMTLMIGFIRKGESKVQVFNVKDVLAIRLTCESF